jgi:hypothetical protein
VREGKDGACYFMVTRGDGCDEWRKMSDMSVEKSGVGFFEGAKKFYGQLKNICAKPNHAAA